MVRMNPSCSPDAGVFAESHVSEDLTVNQCWHVRSDVNLCFLASSAFEEKLDLFWKLVLSK